VDFDFLFQGLEFRVAGDEAGFPALGKLIMSSRQKFNRIAAVRQGARASRPRSPIRNPQSAIRNPQFPSRPGVFRCAGRGMASAYSYEH